MTKLILVFHNFAKKPKNCKVYFLQTSCKNVKWIERAQTWEEEEEEEKKEKDKEEEEKKLEE